MSSGSNGDLLETLSNVAEAEHPTVALADSTRQAFRLLEPWCQARAATSSSRPEVEEIISYIKTQAILYFQAIDMSIKTSQDGVNLAEDILFLCDELPNDQPTDEIIEFIVDMRQVARVSHRQAEATSKQFRAVRSGLMGILAVIPHAAVDVLKDTRKAHKSRVRYERGKAVADVIAKVAMDGRLAGVVAGVLGAVSPVLLFIPALLPLAAFVAEEIGERCARKAEVRKVEEASCKEALKQLERIVHDLDEILDQLDGLVRWWSDIIVMLKSLEDFAPSICSSQLDFHQNRRVMLIRQKWSNIEGQYRKYVHQMSKLQDFYPVSHVLHDPSSSIRLAIASLAGQVEKCEQGLQNACKHVPRKHAVQLRRCLVKPDANLKLESTSLLELLNEALAFTSDELEFLPDEKRDSIVRKLKETLEIVVDQHALVRDVFSTDDVSSALLKSWRRSAFSDVHVSLCKLEQTLSELGNAFDVVGCEGVMFTAMSLYRLGFR